MCSMPIISSTLFSKQTSSANLGIKDESLVFTKEKKYNSEMASSEIVDSGRFSGVQKSHFSQTCNLLSQYLKEKGSFGDLSLGIHRAGTTSTATMDLLPMMEKSGESPSATTTNHKPMNLFPVDAKSEPEKAQMTIFYGGQVFVFNDFPADKAKEIMILASKANKAQQNVMVPPKPKESGADLVTVTPATNMVPNFGNNLIQELPQCQIPSQPIVSDLPIARRASLTRFLEKRKDRLTAKAPYQMSNPKKEEGASKLEESKAWLGLGAHQFPLKTEH